MASKIDRDFLRRLWAEGLSVPEIAARFRVTGPAVMKAANALALPKRPLTRKKARKLDCEVLRRLWAEGLSVTRIAELLGVSEKSVSKSAMKLGLLTGCASPLAAPPNKPLPAGLSALEADIWRARGRWAALAEAARVHAVTVAKAQQVWHRLRVQA